MTTPELLPCPFCTEGKTASTYFDHEQGDKWGYASCDACGARGPEVRTGYSRADNAPWRAEAITAWNTRAPLSTAVLAELPEVKADAVSLNAAEERADTYRAALELITTLGNATAQRIARAALAAAIREGRNG